MLSLPLALQLALTLCLATGQLLPHDPLDYLHAHLAAVSPERETSPWKQFVLENTSQKANAMQASFPSKVPSSAPSVLLFHGDKCLLSSLAGLEWNSSVAIPGAVVLAVASATLPILLEGYKAATFSEPLKRVLKDGDLFDPVFKGYETASLKELLTTLPADSSTEDASQLEGLGRRGRVAVQFAKALLGTQVSAEAWRDALMSVGIEDFSFDDRQGLVTTLKHVSNFGVAMTHLMRNAQGSRVDEKERLPLSRHRYLFGWWLNCATQQDSGVVCLVPNLPVDTILSVGPTLSVYVSPSLSLALVVLNSERGKSQQTSVAEVLEQDREIWQRLYSTLVPPGEGGRLNEEEEEEATWWTMMWSLFWFLVFILSSHVWVYWIMHLVWYCFTAVSRRAHIPRPKTAKEE